MDCDVADPISAVPCEREHGHSGEHRARNGDVILQWLAWPDGPPPRRSCDYSAWSGELVGTACPECGHTSLVHPGSHNPSLAECVLCWLIDRGR